MIRCYLAIMAAIAVQLIDLKLTYLLGSRLVLGTIVGIQASILPLYLNSLSPVSVSGKMGSMNQLLTCYGVITAYSLGFLIGDDPDDELSWRLLVGFPMLPCLLSIVSLQWLFPYDTLERHLDNNELDVIKSYASRIYTNASVEDIEHEKTMHHSKSVLGEYRKELRRYVLALVVVASCQLTGINAIFLYAKQLFQ
jgi:MFS family permease